MINEPGRPGRADPEFGTLLDWLEGRLDPDAAGRVEAAVAVAGPHTLATVAWLREFLETAAALPLREPPAIVRQSLIQYFCRWSRARAELGQRPLELRASLLFDSRQDLALAGVRSAAGSDEAVHLAYTAEAGDLLLDVYPDGPGKVRLDGQVLLAEPGEAPIFEASLAGAGSVIRTKDGDALGRFCLRGVPTARCELRASNGIVTLIADVRLEPIGGPP